MSILNFEWKALYNYLSFYKYPNGKDKINMVLEPLQAMIQLALLSLSPIGTKLTIQENILYLQSPNIIQPVSRWYNSDKKDDLYFLFQVIKRFIKWYNPKINKDSLMNEELYTLIILMAIDGLNNLLKTYGSCDSNTVVQVINMYKDMLELNQQQNIHKIDEVNIDEVLENITKIYDVNLLSMIYNIMLIIKKEDDDTIIKNMIDGFNLILCKNNKMIKEWIKLNLVF
jgi:hypothetical protein